MVLFVKAECESVGRISVKFSTKSSSVSSPNIVLRIHLLQKKLYD